MSSDLRVNKINLRSLDLDRQEISWTIENTYEDVLDYTFQVFRSQGQLGPYDPISPEFQDRYYFVDDSIPVAHRTRTLFYIIRTKHIRTGEFIDTEPLLDMPEADLNTLEIRRQFQYIYREHKGRRCWLFPVRTFGQRCECWDDVLQKRTKTGCKSCFDTGFVRGYMDPIECWVQIEPNPQGKQVMSTGNTEQNNTNAECGFFPFIKPYDILIEGENKRWRVISTVTPENVRAPINWNLVLHEIPPRDIEYALPLKVDPEILSSLSPERNFTNPFNSEKMKEEQKYDNVPSAFNRLSGGKL